MSMPKPKVTPPARLEPLNFADPRNYPLYLAGMATEIAAALVLMAIGFLIALAGTLFLP